MQRPFEFTGRIRSFKYAFAGLWVMLKTQHNAWIHFVATIITIAMAVVYQLTTVEWCFIILAIVSVWMAEALNTAFEFLADVTPQNFIH
ncbi:MAG: diacylglycerol kinase family protein [Cytophagales bacterium]|nr:diacylglycerol kinase family protein [Cytophagales bacterium]